jgi:putative oxidoreductase
MDLAFFVLRLVVGLFFMGHGAQKLFGSFGGHGLQGTGQFFESLGFRPGRTHAQLAGTSEFLGGLLLALGLITPLGALLVISVMTVAIITVHAKNGPWVTDSGYEYNLVLIAVAFAIAAAPGAWSIDQAIGLDEVHGSAFALGALGLGILSGIGAVIAARGGGRTATTSRVTGAAETAAAADRGGRVIRGTAEAEQARRPGIPADPR